MTDKTTLIKRFEDSLIEQGNRRLQEGDELGARRVIKQSQALAPMWASLASRGLIKAPRRSPEGTT